MGGGEGRGGGGGGGTTVLFGSQYEKPKSVIEALSELQQYGALLQQEDIPEDFWTVQQTIDFMMVGFKESLKAGLISLFLMPFSVGVTKNLIPVFGASNPSLFDKIFAMFLSFGYSLGYAFLVLLVSKYYFGGKIVKKAFRDFLSGLYLGKISVVVVSFIFYHFIYFWLTKERFAYLLYKLGADVNLVGRAVWWWEHFRMSFLVSAWMMVVVGVLFIMIPIIGIIYNGIKLKRAREEV